MTNRQFAGCSLGLAIALALSVTPARAQTDTTRRATSELRIPVQKDQGSAPITRRESGGLVSLPAATARIDSLEAAAASYRQRLASLETANANLLSRSAATDRLIAALSDSLRLVRGELATSRADLAAMRSDLTATALRSEALADSVRWLNQRFERSESGLLFGNSGFYVGIGTGANFTTGTLRTLGYSNALHVQVPIGWSRPGHLLGFRTQWAIQRLEGRQRGNFTNPDPEIYSGVAMLTLNFPINTAKTNTFYLMGGGGAYQFRDIGLSSSLAESFPGINATSKRETKLGLTGGAGLEFHVLRGSSFYLQSAFTNVSAEGRNLSWMPVTVGITLR